MFWPRVSYLDRYSESLPVQEMALAREPFERLLEIAHWSETRELFTELQPQFSEQSSMELNNGVVSIGSSAELADATHAKISKLLKNLIPWRKGPFSFYGHEVDAEWRSDLKYERVASALDYLGGKRIADVGCNNGYYLYRMLEQAVAAGEKPELLLGLDPSERFKMQFELFQLGLQEECLHYEMLGVEHMHFFAEFFDVIICMGVLYHRADPVSMLKGLWSSLRGGGQVLIENLAIPGEEPHALFPEDRYAKIRNCYFVPTPSCLVNWMKRAGFVEVEVVSFEKTTFEEQRKTELAPFESLEDFLDPNDESKTVEGYPAPMRAAVVGRKK